LAVLEFELRASSLLSRHSTTWTFHQPFPVLGIFEIGGSWLQVWATGTKPENIILNHVSILNRCYHHHKQCPHPSLPRLQDCMSPLAYSSLPPSLPSHPSLSLSLYFPPFILFSLSLSQYEINLLDFLRAQLHITNFPFFFMSSHFPSIRLGHTTKLFS
jgi:hypothetical protein